LLSIGVLAVGGWYGYTKLAGSIPGIGSKSAKALPQRKSGALTEFPVDTATTSPAKPVSVSTAQLRGGRGPVPVVKGLPPGVTPGGLRNQASAITTATYQSSPADAPVTVHVIEAQAPESLQTTISEEVAQGAGGVVENTGVQVTSPEGQIYRGRKIRTSLGALVYVLAKTGASILILIYSPQAAGAPVAERLATNVGNGAGLYDYAEVPGAVTLFPAAPPAGLTLTGMTSYAGSDLANIEELRRTLGAQADAVKPYIPDRVVTATYADAANREWKLMAGDFGGAARAWFAWSALRWSTGVSGLEVVSYPGGEGLTLVQQGERYLVSRDGSRIILVAAPAAEDVQRLALLGRSLRF
jgi:hypothetical protein